MKIWKLRAKRSDETLLTIEESMRLDAALEATENQIVVKSVKNLSDEEPSLAWRSSLNTRLGSAYTKKRSSTVWMRALWAVGCGCVAWIAFVFVTTVRPEERPIREHSVAQVSVEDAILADHQDAVSQTSLGIYIGYGDPQDAEASLDETRS